MSDSSTVILYHGTDVESALNILNQGLNIHRLLELQSKRSVQLGAGWYTTEDIDVAWYFAALSLETMSLQGAVIEMELFVEYLESLIEQGLAVKSEIYDALFQAEQIWFHLDAFEFLNRNAVFRPYTGN